MLFTAEEYVDIASQFYHRQEFDYALEFVNKAIAKDSSLPDAWQLKGNIEAEEKNFDKAINSYAKCIELDDTYSDAHHFLSQIAADKKDFNQALTHISKAVTSVNGYRDDYYKTLAHIYYNLKDFDNCNKIADAIRTEHFDDEYACIMKMNSLFKLGRYEEAAEVCEKYTHVNSESVDAWNNYGFSLILLEDYNRAKHALDTALNYDPEHSYANDNYGFVLLKQGYPEEALQSIDLAIERDRSNSYAYKNRALVNLHLGNKSVAKPDLLRARELHYADIHDNEVDDILLNEFHISTEGL